MEKAGRHLNCKLPKKSDSLKIERILEFKLYEKD